MTAQPLSEQYDPAKSAQPVECGTDRILVVEDSQTQAEQLRLHLEEAGFSVTLAVDAERAITILQDHPFDLIVSDIMLPGQSGYDLCEKVKKGEAEPEIPVLVLSTLSDPMAIIRALESGADYYLTKPYEPEHLVARIRTALATKKIRAGSKLKVGVEVLFLNRRFTIRSDREQILDLLMSTFEDIVRTNAELERARAGLTRAMAIAEKHADDLEKQVQRRTEELLEQSSILLQAQRIAKIGHWRVDTKTWMVQASNELYDAWGVEPRPSIPFQEILDLVHPDDRAGYSEIVANAAAGSGSFEFETRMIDPSGRESIRWITGSPELDSCGGVVALFGVAQDITERRRSEAQVAKMAEQLYQAQKMEAVGQLTGGLSHDFNNLLAIIVGNLDMVRESVTDATALRDLDEAVEAALRGADLNHRLLAFAKRQTLVAVPTDANALVEQTHRLLERVLGETIEVSLSLEDELDPVLIDPAQLESAITNLALNARDAMPTGGSITIATRSASVSDDSCVSGLQLRPGRYAIVSVTDTGSGMSPEVLNRVREPFYTTKEPGKGSGLGLSMVSGFAEQSGGGLAIESEMGVGTTMSLFLPISTKMPTPSTTSAAMPKGLGETILAVEDNCKLRAVLVQQLKALGYHTLEASSGHEALKILATDYPIDLLMTDVVMPEMDGKQLASEALKIRSNLNILFTSGFSDDVLNEPSLDSPSILRKPYRRGALAEAISSALHGLSEAGEPVNGMMP